MLYLYPVQGWQEPVIDIAVMPKYKIGHAFFLRMIDTDTKIAATWLAYFEIPAAMHTVRRRVDFDIFSQGLEG